MSERQMPPPITGPESRPFWEAAAERRFFVKRCNACERSFWYPRALCPMCLSDDTTWIEGPTTGVVYAFSVIRRAKVPYVLAYVALDGGPTMMTNIVNTDPDAVAIGQRVSLTFLPATDGSLVPVFEPARDGTAG